MNNRFLFWFKFFMLFNVLLGASAIFVLFDWSKLSLVDRWFYSFSSVLLFAGFGMAWLFRSLDSVPSSLPSRVDDAELERLRDELKDFPPKVEPVLSRSEEYERLTEDVSMYLEPRDDDLEQKRNILKPMDESNNINDYSNIF